jgi:hypothetical protein
MATIFYFTCLLPEKQGVTTEQEKRAGVNGRLVSGEYVYRAVYFPGNCTAEWPRTREWHPMEHLSHKFSFPSMEYDTPLLDGTKHLVSFSYEPREEAADEQGWWDAEKQSDCRHDDA